MSEDVKLDFAKAAKNARDNFEAKSSMHLLSCLAKFYLADASYTKKISKSNPAILPFLEQLIDPFEISEQHRKTASYASHFAGDCLSYMQLKERGNNTVNISDGKLRFLFDDARSFINSGSADTPNLKMEKMHFTAMNNFMFSAFYLSALHSRYPQTIVRQLVQTYLQAGFSTPPVGSFWP